MIIEYKDLQAIDRSKKLVRKHKMFFFFFLSIQYLSLHETNPRTKGAKKKLSYMETTTK